MVLGVFGITRALLMPASQALQPNLVPQVALPNAVALNSSAFHVSAVLGPILGGVLLILGPDVVYITAGILLFFAHLTISKVNIEQIERKPVLHTKDDFLAGFRFIWKNPVLLGALSLDFVAVFFGGAIALMPAIATDLLNTGEAGLGVLKTAPALGAMAIALTLAYFPIQFKIGFWLFGSIAFFGLFMSLVALSNMFFITLLLLALAGGADMISVYIRNLLIQLNTQDALRGRVSAVNSVFIGASNELGDFESGVTAEWLGLKPAILLGGGATIAVTGIFTRIFPGLFIQNKLVTTPTTRSNEP